ncbi:chromate efflux transporter [Portibacter lacus]|uniref:Chromate transporter n=1 Tax=Portibacter lacus TaxID=1099794 RepID=A0AA37WEH5_9BACT|nr:chromate efflux transporter [Portibacter lacus]GLR16065.1 chromate transporter [Portibacter lacus]
MKKASNLKEIALVFLKLGLVAFGGPAAHIAMMEAEIVEKRKWITPEHFLDLIGATNLIPGPNSTEMTMHCGHERGGIAGLFIAGACFILPAVILTGILAHFYVEYGTLPEIQPFIYGIKPAVLAIIAGAIFKLGKKAIKNTTLAILGLLTIGISLAGISEVLALLAIGVFGTIYFMVKDRLKNQTLNSIFIPVFLFKSASGLISTSKIFFTFLKIGAILYGSGYVLFAYLDSELVLNGFLSRSELIDAIAIGQFTPGPVLSTATFIGYQLGGFSGAVLATLGIFLPSFILVWILNPYVPKMRQSKLLSYFLDVVNVAAVGIMCSVLYKMGLESISDWRTLIIGTLSFILVFGLKKVNVIFLVLGGSILGYLLTQI